MTAKEPTALGVPEIAPFAESIESPAGSPEARNENEALALPSPLSVGVIVVIDCAKMKFIVLPDEPTPE